MLGTAASMCLSSTKGLEDGMDGNPASFGKFFLVPSTGRQPSLGGRKAHSSELRYRSGGDGRLCSNEPAVLEGPFARAPAQDVFHGGAHA